MLHHSIWHSSEISIQSNGKTSHYGDEFMTKFIDECVKLYRGQGTVSQWITNARSQKW